MRSHGDRRARSIVLRLHRCGSRGPCCCGGRPRSTSPASARPHPAAAPDHARAGRGYSADPQHSLGTLPARDRRVQRDRVRQGPARAVRPLLPGIAGRGKRPGHPLPEGPSGRFRPGPGAGPGSGKVLTASPGADNDRGAGKSRGSATQPDRIIAAEDHRLHSRLPSCVSMGRSSPQPVRSRRGPSRRLQVLGHYFCFRRPGSRADALGQAEPVEHIWSRDDLV